MVLFLMINLLRKRWQSNSEEIYLTKTKLEQHQLLFVKTPEHLKFKIFDLENNDYKKIVSNRALIEERDEYLETVLQRLKKGDRLIAIIDSTTEKPISFLFVALNNITLNPIHKKISIEKNAIGVYDVYTYPEYRKKGFYEIILSLTIKFFFEQNFNYLYLWVMKQNQISVKTHSNLLINNVIAIFSERYLYGFRIVKSKNELFQLNKLLHD